MEPASLKIVILGLSITSSWGNGHATTYRALVRELARRGHDVLFLERDTPWYRDNRDMPKPPYGRTELYFSLNDLQRRFSEEVESADAVIVGSYVPEGVRVGRWVTDTAAGAAAFYDIDTPITIAKLKAGDRQYISEDLIPEYGLYLSFTGGPILDELEDRYGSPMARPLYCSVDPDCYYPERTEKAKWEMGYLGTYSDDRQPLLDELMLEPARAMRERSFVVAGPLYPDTIVWPGNVERITHLPPHEHRGFYNSMNYALNITRAEMARAGWSPSVRLFEAAACATPVISDRWPGLEGFFAPGSEILISGGAKETIEMVRDIPPEERAAIGQCAKKRVLERHTAAHRADELEGYLAEAMSGCNTRSGKPSIDGLPDCGT